MNWYVLYTRPNHDLEVGKRVQQMGYEMILPLRRVQKAASHGLMVEGVAPLFRRYVFVRCCLEYSDLELFSLPGVIDFLTDVSGNPFPISESEKSLVCGAAELGQAGAHIYIEVPRNDPDDAEPVTLLGRPFFGASAYKKDDRFTLEIPSLRRVIVVEYMRFMCRPR